MELSMLWILFNFCPEVMAVAIVFHQQNLLSLLNIQYKFTTESLVNKVMLCFPYCNKETLLFLKLHFFS